MASWIRDLLVPSRGLGNKGNWWMGLGTGSKQARVGGLWSMAMPPPRCRRCRWCRRARAPFPVFPHDSVGLLVSLAAGGPRAFACSRTCHKASGPAEQASQTLQPMESAALSASAPRLVFPAWAAAAANHAAWQSKTRVEFVGSIFVRRCTRFLRDHSPIRLKTGLSHRDRMRSVFHVHLPGG